MVKILLLYYSIIKYIEQSWQNPITLRKARTNFQQLTRLGLTHTYKQVQSIMNKHYSHQQYEINKVEWTVFYRAGLRDHGSSYDKLTEEWAFCKYISVEESLQGWYVPLKHVCYKIHVLSEWFLGAILKTDVASNQLERILKPFIEQSNDCKTFRFIGHYFSCWNTLRLVNMLKQKYLLVLVSNQIKLFIVYLVSK